MDTISATRHYIDEAIQRSWEVTPTSIYGLLLGILTLIIIALGVAVIVQWRESNSIKKRFEVLLGQNIAVIQAFTSKFDGDGRELADRKLEDTLRGVVQSEVTAIKRTLEKIRK